MYQTLVKVNDRIYACVKLIMMLLLCAMSLMVFSAVIFRFSGISLPWIEEFAIYAFSWLTYFGAAVVLRNDGHLSVTSFIDSLKNKKIRNVLLMIGHFIVLVFVCTVAFYSVDMVSKFFRYGAVTTTIPWLKMGWVFIQIPINYTVYTLFTIEKIWKIAGEQKEGSEPC